MTVLGRTAPILAVVAIATTAVVYWRSNGQRGASGSQPRSVENSLPSGIESDSATGPVARSQLETPSMASLRGEEPPPPPPVYSDPLEQRFLINGKRVSELNLEAMSLSDLEQVTRQIGEYQVQVQADFFERWPADSLSMISAADYEEQQLYMHEEMLFLLTRKDGFLSTDLAMVSPGDFPELTFLRSMLQRVRATDAYAAKEEEEYETWVREMEQQFPECRRIENVGRTVVKFIHPDGTVRASRRVMTVGNF